MSFNSNRENNSFRKSAYWDKLRILRTYDNPSGAQNPGPATDYQIWQVAAATVAAPSYFSPVRINGEEFLDGALGAKNPSQLAIKELSTLYETNHICMVSIGSGIRRPWFRDRSGRFGRLLSVVETAMEFMTDSENVHRYMLDCEKLSERVSYFRLNVPGLEDIAMDQIVLKRSRRWVQPAQKDAIAFIRARTREYLQQTETRELIKSCARTIVESRRRQESLPPRSSKKTSEKVMESRMFRFRETTPFVGGRRYFKKCTST